MNIVRKLATSFAPLSRFIVCTCCLWLVFPHAYARAAEFIRLGYLHEIWRWGSRASSISDDGSVIAGTTPISDDVSNAPFRWTRETGMVALDSSQASDSPIMSSDGSLIAWEARPELSRILPQDSGRFDFDFRFVGDGLSGSADETISHDGSVLVGNAKPSSPSGTPEGLALWTPQGGIQTLGITLGIGTGATGWYLHADDIYQRQGNRHKRISQNKTPADCQNEHSAISRWPKIVADVALEI